MVKAAAPEAPTEVPEEVLVPEAELLVVPEEVLAPEAELLVVPEEVLVPEAELVVVPEEELVEAQVEPVAARQISLRLADVSHRAKSADTDH